MKKENIKAIRNTLKLKHILITEIDKFLKKNYTEDENFEAMMQWGEDVGFFKTKSKGKKQI